MLSPVDREHLVGNIATHASRGVTPEVLRRVVEYWAAVHPELGTGVARALRLEQVPT